MFVSLKLLNDQFRFHTFKIRNTICMPNPMHRYRPLRLLFSVIVLSCATSLGAQIVNVEKKRTPTDSTWVGTIELSFAGSKTTKSTLSILSGGTLQYKPKNKKDFW